MSASLFVVTESSVLAENQSELVVGVANQESESPRLGDLVAIESELFGLRATSSRDHKEQEVKWICIAEQGQIAIRKGSPTRHSSIAHLHLLSTRDVTAGSTDVFPFPSQNVGVSTLAELLSWLTVQKNASSNSAESDRNIIPAEEVNALIEHYSAVIEWLARRPETLRATDDLRRIGGVLDEDEGE